MAWIIRTHRRIVRNEAAGLGAVIIRSFLRVLSLPYGAVVRLRSLAYRLGLLRSYLPSIPVVSIGNITTGGVGKTPFVQTVVDWLTAAGRAAVVLSRGYKGHGGANDEALLLKENLPTTPHLQNPDRVAAVAQIAEQRLGDVVVLDDGFQHRRLGRTVDIALIDATDSFGGDRLLPAGFLREPVSALARADAVVLTRVGLITESERTSIRGRVESVAPKAVWAEVDFQPVAWSQFGATPKPIGLLAGKKALAFCAIGNPNAFRTTLERLGVVVCDLEIHPDHHWYAEEDLAHLGKRAQELGADALVATQKDVVKIPVPSLAGIPLYSLKIATRFRSGENALRQLVVDRVAAFGA